MKLDVTVYRPLHDVQLAAINRIDEEDFSGVKRKVREELLRCGRVVTERFLDDGILALKQYYCVALLDPLNEHAVTDAIDPFWHAHILHTKQYIKFCDDVFGQYVHHEPLDHAVGSEVSRVGQLYRHTQRVYRKMFSSVSEAFYPAMVSDDQLVCRHQEIQNPVLRSISRFSAIAHHEVVGF